jgi:glyoxylase-like metal-dependent hydrolase (beta-lactamase superfamily II)
MSDHETYEVFALKYAERSDRTRHDSFIFDDDHASPHPIDYFIWVIRNAKRTVVVDTGYGSAEGIKRNRRVTREPREALSMLGINATTVPEVIITHLHYDHAGTLEHFPAARFHLQETEMAYATGHCMCEPALRHPFTVDHVCEMVRHVYSGRVVFHNGDAQIAPGVTVHRIGGHTGGLQCVRIKTTHGWLVLASDAAHYYENLQQRKPFPIVVDVQAMLRGFDRLYALAETPAHIVPGHDPLVCAKYPPASAALDSVVYRLDVSPR